jgi:hydrogenase nickel incorporation protein HypB
VLVIAKTDLLPYVPFIVAQAEQDARRIQPGLDVFPLSALSGEGVEAWCKFLETERRQFLANPPSVAPTTTISPLGPE